MSSPPLLSSSSCRVDFTTQGGSALNGKQQIKINRTPFPTNLQSLPNYSIIQWEEFCNRIDSVLESLASLRKRNSRMSFSILGLSIFLLAITPLITKVWLGDVLGNFWYVAMFAILTIPLFASCYLINSAKARDQQIVQDLYNVCREASSTEQTSSSSMGGGGANFYLRREQVHRQDKNSMGIVKYIEVVVFQHQDDGDGDGNEPNHNPQRMTRPSRRPRTPDTVVSSDEALGTSSSTNGGSSSGHGTLPQLVNVSFQDHRSGPVPGPVPGPVQFISTFDRLRALGSGPQNTDPSHQV
jgi:hypothetical protein